MDAKTIAAKAKALRGRPVVARMKDGSTVAGTLVRLSGQRLYVAPARAAGKRKRVGTKALLPLLLFDVAAIGAGYPQGFGPYGPYGPYGPGPYAPYPPYGPVGPYGGIW